MKLLGLRTQEHDSNFSYYDGKTVHYYKSERYFREKHHGYKNLFSWKQEIKRIWDIDHQELDEIAIVVDPTLPHCIGEVAKSKTNIPPADYSVLVKESDCLETPVKTYRINHHYAHALSTWMLHPNPDVHFVVDGFGDLETSWSVFKNHKQIDFGTHFIDGSIGMSVAALGQAIGIRNTHGLDVAGKLMGLQSYGNLDEQFINTILKPYGIRNINPIFEEKNWIAYKKNQLLAHLTSLDAVRSIHHHVGNMLVDFFSEFANSDDVISYSGGVAQNVIWNTLLKSKFKNLIIAPHCGDEGLSLGALEWLRLKNKLEPFELNNFPYMQSDEAPNTTATLETIKKTAKYLSEGKIVAWYQNHGEIGPRALGNRSILMDPRIIDGKDKINTVKHREAYRPFGASVLSSHKDNYFYNLPDNPYMLYVARVKTNEYPAITHVDNTCRAQTVDENTIFGNLLKEFYNLTGCAMLLNTSLNVAGKPIAGFIKDAKILYNGGLIDVLVLGDEIFIRDN